MGWRGETGALFERIYRLLLKLYPAEFRREYGDQMAQAFRDLYRDAARRRSVLGIAVFLLFITAETAARVLIERRDALRRQVTLSGSVPYSRLHLLLAFVPVTAFLLYRFLVQRSQSSTEVYLLILIAGVGVWVLSRLRLLPPNPIWNVYVVGILLGVISIILFFLTGLPAFGVYRLGLPPVCILLVSGAIYALAIHYTGRWMGASAPAYRLIAALLMLTTAAGFVVNTNRVVGDIALFLSFSYDLMQTLAALIACAVCVRLGQRMGWRLALVALMVAIGVQFMWVDPGYFTGQASLWIDLSVLLFPVIVCPAWWLMASRRGWRVRGTLALWLLLIGVVAIVPSLARVALQIDYETPGVWVHRALAALPYLAAVALALRLDAGADVPEDRQMDDPPETSPA